MYFLVIGCVQLDVFFPGLSPTHWSTTIGPLLIVLTINALKEMVDDYGRHKSDAMVNAREVDVVRVCDGTSKSSLTAHTTSWRQIRVGDLVRIKSGSEIPADVLLLDSSDAAKIAYVETANLDGETNLKVKSSPGVITHDANGSGGTALPSAEKVTEALKNARLECETPNNQLYKFEGKWLDNNSSTTTTLPLSVDNMLLRGSTLRNTKWALGLVIFTGGDSKLMRNATAAPVKKSRLEKHMNLLVLAVGVFQTLVGLILAGFQREWVWGQNLEVAADVDGSLSQQMRHWYLTPSNVWPDVEGANASTFFTQFVRFIVLLNALIPISLYVTLEFVKVVQCAWINFDRELYDSVNDKRCGVRTTTLNEELGAVQCVLSDKTGTLTKNVMAFVKCSVNGVVYQGDLNQGTTSKLNDTAINYDYAPESRNNELLDGTTSVRIELRENADLKKSKSQKESIAQKTHTVANSNALRSAITNKDTVVDLFLSHLVTCHTVVPEAVLVDGSNVGGDGSDDGSQSAIFGGFKYQASSPDEEALVTGAALLGRRLVGNVNGTIEVNRHAPPGFDSAKSHDVFFQGVTGGVTGSVTPGRDVYSSPRESFSKPHCLSNVSNTSETNPPDTGVDSVTVLAINEFTSARKRMSVVVRDLRYPKGEQLRVRLKGADAAVLERCAAPIDDEQKGIQNLTKQHLDEFANEGLRTLVLAERVLTESEFNQWMERYTEASASLVDREEKLASVAEQIETNCALVGVTAVEDKLADGVPETIQLLRKAGVLVWMLTGDKLETAVSIANTCRLIDKHGDLVVVRESDFEKDANFLEMKATEAAEDALLGSSFGLVIEGGALQYALSDMKIGDFLKLCDACSGGVVCCRVSPIQKARVAEAMKKHNNQVVLGIGDGANDVGLIKASHVGIGISGREGRAAVMASDFSIGSFSSLARLLLVHGRFSAKRNREVVLYAFFKNFTYAMANVWFSCFSGFSAQATFPTPAIATFNVLWTSLPTIAHACFDQDVEAKNVVKNPELYKETARPSAASGYDFAIESVWWTLSAAWSSVWCYFCTFVPLSELGSVGAIDGSSSGISTLDIMSTGLAAFTAIVLTCDAKIAMRTNHWTIVNVVCFAGSVILWFPFIILLGSCWKTFGVFGDVANVHSVLFSNVRFWLALLLAVVGCVVPDMFVEHMRRVIQPSLGEVVRECEMIEKRIAIDSENDESDSKSESTSLSAIRFASKSFRHALYTMMPSASRRNGGLPTKSSTGRSSLPSLWPESCKRRKSRNPSVLEVVKHHRNHSDDWNP